MTHLGPAPVVILGAPRSGTNLLRDLLAAQPGFTTWPCDEINAIWRHGQPPAAPDTLLPEHLGPRGRLCIRRAFARRARHGRVVEKTCANTLRVPYVAAAVPEAVYVLIERNPLDAVASAMQRWQGRAGWAYLLRKLRWVPPADLAPLVVRGLARKWAQQRDPGQRLPLWGPVFPGLATLAATAPLAEVCSRQWLACSQSARQGLAQLPDAPAQVLRYEDLVAAPERCLAELLQALGAEPVPAAVQQAAARVSGSRVGRGRQLLSAADLARVQAVLAEVA